MAEVDPKFIELYWNFLKVCLCRVFGKSDREAHEAVVKMRARTEELPEPTALLFYRDSPLQIASILAGASDRGLTEKELLAYDELWRDPNMKNMKDRPTREQVLQVHGVYGPPKVG